MATTPLPARDRAVVVGASMAGLLAARVLADHFSEVVLIERDQLPEGAENRRAVPQGRHLHSLLGRGDEILRELFPGIRDDFAAAGAESALSTREVRFVTEHGPLRQVDVTDPALCATRPLIESVVRQRVLDLQGVVARDATDVTGLIAGDDGRIRGLTIFPHAEGAESELAADLVVDASGRSGRSVAWLDALRYGRPPEQTIQSDLAYASRRYRLAGSPGTDRFIVVTAQPERPLGMAAGIVEEDSWVVTMFGYGRHRPSAAEEDFLPQLAAIAPPDLVAALRDGEPLGPVEIHRTPTSIWRRYETMRRFPRGLLVFGDALCAFNPIYGQGMTVAAQQALALRAWLASGNDDPRAFFRLARPAVKGAWDIVAGADLSIPEVAGPRPVPVRVVGKYMSRLQAAAVDDEVVATAYFRVLNLLDPPSALLRPGIGLRVARHALRPNRAPARLPQTEPAVGN